MVHTDIFTVEGKRCLITGASSGLGAHFARTLLVRGAHVYGASRAEPDWVPASGGGRFEHFSCDVTSADQVSALFKRVGNDGGALNILINNAGECHVAKAIDADSAQLQSIFNVNVVAAAQISALAAASMKGSGFGGSIINVSSVLASTTMNGLSSYAASKAALQQLTRSQAAEWAKWGVRVNALAPGWFPSRMTEPFLERGLDAVLKGRIPQRRLGEPSDLDGALLLLASDAGRYMTGVNLQVDGGFSLIN